MNWNCREWTAWHNFMPGTAPKLHVWGQCEMATPGYELELRYKEPQGSNPQDLLLTLHVVYEPDWAPDVLWWTDAKYEQETDLEYATVTIVGVASSIPVQRVE